MSKPAASDVLFSEFEKKSKKDWIDIANEDLKGADFTKKLVWNTLEGFPLDPFYTIEDTRDLAYFKNYHNMLPVLSHNPGSPRSWHYMERISANHEKKANSIAHEALHLGADGIQFYLPDHKKINLVNLIYQLSPNENPMKFHLTYAPERLVEEYINYCSMRQDIPLEDISGGISCDIISNYSLTGNLDEAGFDSLAECVRHSEKMPHFKVLTINGNQFLNAGSDAAHEIAFSLNIMVEYIDRLAEKSISLRQIIKNLNFSVATGTNYFMEIAKLKALRILYHYVLSAFETHLPSADDLLIHCDTSLWTKTLYDPHVNMLRNTTEAMAAILGGASSLTISPFDTVFSKINDFSRRISRNISNLLKEESYFDKVIDPSAGSYYLETLIDKLIERSLDIFKEIESEGGFVKAFEKGLIQRKISVLRNKKFELASNRKMVIVGTNQYANPDEKINPGELEWKDLDLSESSHHLIPARASYHFERLRLNTDQYVWKNGENKRPKVFLSLIGDQKVMRKARANFAQGFFGCTGFRVTESSPSSSLFKSVQKAIESNADIVVMCGSDEDYIENGVDFAKAFKANHHGLLVVAGNPAEVKDALLSAGVDEFIHIKTNVIDVLHQFQVKLKILQA